MSHSYSSNFKAWSFSSMSASNENVSMSKVVGILDIPLSLIGMQQFLSLLGKRMVI